VSCLKTKLSFWLWLAKHFVFKNEVLYKTMKQCVVFLNYFVKSLKKRYETMRKTLTKFDLEFNKLIFVKKSWCK